MLDLRPVGYVIGLTVLALGLTMLPPLIVDIAEGRGHWPAFAESALLTVLCGGLVAMSCRNGVGEGLTIQQTFLLTSGVWVVLPVFGALPFMIGAPDLGLTDAVFEAMSGLTTTGSTVMEGLDGQPKGILLWRGVLQWLGGVGIIVVAMVFLPELRVGGMQIFRSSGFDTMGKILPRATEIASRISVIYLSLTLICVTAYLFTGMDAFDATVHAMLPVRALPTDEAARRMIRALGRSRRTLFVPLYARLTWWIYRFTPSLLFRNAPGTMRRYRELTATQVFGHRAFR